MDFSYYGRMGKSPHFKKSNGLHVMLQEKFIEKVIDKNLERYHDRFSEIVSEFRQAARVALTKFETKLAALEKKYSETKTRSKAHGRSANDDS